MQKGDEEEEEEGRDEGYRETWTHRHRDVVRQGHTLRKGHSDKTERQRHAKKTRDSKKHSETQ